MAVLRDAGGVGIVLRFGGFYGPDAMQTEDFVRLARNHVAPMGGSKDGYMPMIHLDDTATAVVAAPAIGFAIHSSEPPPGTAQSSLLAEPVERVWRETTNQPLRLFGGYEEFTDAVPFYMPSQPFAVHVLDGVAVSQALEARS